MRYVCLGILAALILGCTEAREQNIVGSWQLQDLVGDNGTINVQASENPAFISFEADNNFHGNAGCNNFFGSYEINAKALKINHNVGMTRMMCAGESMNVEDTLIKLLLSDTKKVEIKGNHLILQEGSIKAVFAKH